jgi:adenine deaminase
MRILVREGSVAKNLAALAPFAKEHDFCLVSDDMIAPDLVHGHLDGLLARAVSVGIDPLRAVRAVTITPAEHYRLPLGVIEPGRLADIVKVRDLSGFSVEEVYIGGTRVAEGGRPAFSALPVSGGNPISVSPRVSGDFAVPARDRSVTVRVIGLIRNEIVTGSETSTLNIKEGRAVPDRVHDILPVSVVNRYRDAPVMTGFVRGFGLKKGAIASSIAHDSHNIIVVGADPEDMAGAANTLIRESGGLCYTEPGFSLLLPLKLGGLMSTERPGDVCARLSLLHAKTREAGCGIDRPFMTMSFLSLLVVPHLKIGDRGLFDVDAGRFVDPVLPRSG